MKKQQIMKAIFYILIVTMLVATSVFTGWRISLAQGGDGSEPDGNAAQVDESTVKGQESSSVDLSGSMLSEEKTNPITEDDSKGPLNVLTVNADGEATLSEPQNVMPGTELSNPTKVRESLTAPDSPDAPWPEHWFGVLAAAFSPSSSSTTYNYGYVGCIHATLSGQWRAAVNLPDGAIAKYIYIQYYNPDNLAGSAASWFTRYKYDGTMNDIVSVTTNPGSTGTGYRYKLSTEITTNNVIDNVVYVYAFIWNGSTTQYFCSMQVGFYPPAHYLENLPTVIK